MAYKILDISYYQPNVDYAKTAKAVDGVILRIGLTYWGAQAMGKDECFEKHYAGFKAQGCPVGVYYYSAADSVAVAEKEAAYCLELMKGKQFELPIYYDVENNQRQGTLSKALLTTIVDTFCSRVQNAGYYVGFYASTSWLLNKMDTAALSKKYTLWKADYRTAYDKTIPCDMHQYTSGATVAGINGRVDMSNCWKDFPCIIKGKGLNGFDKAEAEATAPNIKPVRLLISAMGGEPMSKGDVMAFTGLLDALKIKYEATVEGYVITIDEVSHGDIETIEDKADDIGNIDVTEYVPDTAHHEKCAECDLLQKEIAGLKAQLIVEQQYKNGYWKDVQNLSAKLEQVNKENEELKNVLQKIKEMVGG